MNLTQCLSALVLAASLVSTTVAGPPAYEKLVLSDKFYSEGAYYADFNRDEHIDIVAGPFWYAGPDFKRRYEYREPREFSPLDYSDNFLTYTGDFNGDEWPDVLCVPYPGTDAYWYENPGKSGDNRWTSHLALKNVGNESPAWIDINGDGRRDLVFNIDGYLGYGTWNPHRPDQPWAFHKISPQGDYQRFTHGVGAGDINGDGRMDIVESKCWWEQSEDKDADGPWKRHPYEFADAAAHMGVLDINGDGLLDVVNAWHCHLYGLVWHEQKRTADGKIHFVQHEILPPEPDMASPDLRISQLHALTIADIDCDGVQDIVTGKRYWSHGPTGDVEADAPPVLYWFRVEHQVESPPKITPFEIDNNSGIGTQVTAVDLNKDKTPDVVVCNKKGTFVFLSKRENGSQTGSQ
ncbi:VCBS repeat-containing protein [Aeoliella sp. ICT_H6.2]|uniref:VCBS repeat-containing protein n=1 Tax=Aeoliella straminimaris TaxID=2954799 RepID=A0A9X2JK59_9BACT|nr:VCBS repeat-containing protein [Aeoliella straminimaris]MCO6047668.1 VCBS repeat-containing protein [Aeoliella straminimaris]